jgi:Domain of unknown function (DUF1902)
MPITPYDDGSLLECRGVRVATSETILGLATEADTIAALTPKRHHIVPELMALNSLTDPQLTGR